MNRRTLRNLRRVWATLTQEPQISVRVLGRRLGLAYTTAARYVRVLVAAGYVEQNGRRARRVLVPLWEGR